MPGLLKIFETKIIYLIFLQISYILKQRSYLLASGPNATYRLALYDLPRAFKNIN